MKVGFIINGEDQVFDVDGDVPMPILVEMALDESRNTARPREDWELRDMYGRTLEPAGMRLRDLQPDSRLFLTLKVGAGGALRAA